MAFLGIIQCSKNTVFAAKKRKDAMAVRSAAISRMLGLSAIVLTASCSGGDSDGQTPPPPPQNSAPVITASGTVSAEENTIVTVAITASDADGDSLDFSLGGSDSALFEISDEGVVTSLAPFDFEAPSDDNNDNEYLLTVNVSDGEETTSAQIAISITDANTNGFVKINGVAMGDAIGGSVSAAPDGDGDGESDLAIGTFKKTPTTPVSEAVAYWLFSDSMAFEANTTIDLDGLDAADGIEFFVGGLPQNPVLFGALLVAPGIAPANMGLGSGYLLVSHLGNINDQGVGAFFPGAVADISAVGSVDFDADPLRAGARSSRNNDFGFAGQTSFSDFNTTGDFNGDGVTDILVERLFSVDGFIGGDFLIVSGTEMLNDTKPQDLFNAPSPGSDVAARFTVDGGFVTTANGVFAKNAGDVTGDGADDIVVSLSQSGNLQSDRVVILSGRAIMDDADGFVSLSDLSFPDLIQIEAGSVTEQLSVARGGDFDGDGRDDVVIGSVTVLDSPSGALGGAFVFFSDQLLADADGVVSLDDLPGPLGAKILNADASLGIFHAAIGVSDLNGGGRDDLTIAMQSSASLGVRSSVFVVFGEYLETIGATALRLSEPLGGRGIEIRGPRIPDVTALDSDFFGQSIAQALDVDGDNLQELIIGAPGEGAVVTGGLIAEGSGAVYVVPSTRIAEEAAGDALINLESEF